MSNLKGTSRAQTNFLRAFRTDPFGPSVDKWPSPAILRRWLRRPGFCEAMKSIRDAMRYQSDFQLLSAAASAAHALHTSVGAPGEPEAKRMKVMNDLMRLAHVRERFASEEPPRPKRDTLLLDMVCTAHENASIGALRRMFQHYTGRDLRAEYQLRIEAAQKLPEEERSIPPACIPLGQWKGDEQDDLGNDPNDAEFEEPHAWGQAAERPGDESEPSR